MKKWLTLLTLAFVQNFSFSQDEVQFNWVQIALGGSYSETLSVDTDENLDIYHCGRIDNYGQPDFSQVDSLSTSTAYGYISKVNASGNFIWGKTFKTSTTIANCPNVMAVRVLNSGDVICAIDFLSTVDFDPSPAVFEMTSSGGSNIALLKLSSNGDFIWAKSLKGKNAPSSSCYLHGFDIDEFDNIIISGEYSGTFDFDPGVDSTILSTAVNNTSMAGYLLKLNSDGEFMWVRSIDGPSHDGLYDLAVDHNNHIITAGYFYDSLHIQSAHLDTIMESQWVPHYHQMILKYDENGEALWVTKVGTVSWYVHDIGIDSNNDILMSGHFFDVIIFGNGANDFRYSKGASDGFVAKYTSDGNFSWGRQIGGSYYDVAHSLQTYSNGNSFFAIQSSFDSLYLDSLLLFDNAPIAATSSFTLMLDEDGNFEGALPFNGSNATITNIKLDGAGGLISVGSCITGPDWFLDFDPNIDGEYFSTEHGEGAFIHKMTLIDYPKTTEEIVLYPNPTNGNTTIFIADLESTVSAKIFDYAGRLVKEFDIDEKLFSIDLYDIPLGISIIEFTLKNTIINKKLIKI